MVQYDPIAYAFTLLVHRCLGVQEQERYPIGFGNEEHFDVALVAMVNCAIVDLIRIEEYFNVYAPYVPKSDAWILNSKYPFIFAETAKLSCSSPFSAFNSNGVFSMTWFRLLSDAEYVSARIEYVITSSKSGSNACDHIDQVLLVHANVECTAHPMHSPARSAHACQSNRWS